MCVDTPSILSARAGAAAWFALACSHGGDVVGVDGVSGGVRWRTALPGRCEAGLAVTPDLRRV